MDVGENNKTTDLIMSIVLILLCVSAFVLTLTISWTILLRFNSEREYQTQMYELQLKHQHLKIEADSALNAYNRKWQDMPSQYWEGRGEE